MELTIITIILIISGSVFALVIYSLITDYNEGEARIQSDFQKHREDREREKERHQREEREKRDWEARNEQNRRDAVAAQLGEITSFEVNNGRGAHRGSVQVSIEWKGGPDMDLYVLKNRGRLFTDPSDIKDTSYRHNAEVVGHETNGASFRKTDFDVEEMVNYNFYCWVKGKAKYTHHEASDVNRLGEDSLRWTRAESRALSRSIAVQFAETQEEFTERRERSEAEKEKQNKLVAKPDDSEEAVPIRQIIDEVLAKRKEDMNVLQMIDDTVEEYSFNEEDAEFFRGEVIRRYYEKKAE